MIQQTPNPMLETSLAPITWALVADAAGARIFEFQKAALPWRLRDTLKGDGTGHPAQTADFGSKASNHKGALHGHGEDTPKETGERRLAHTLAQVLEKGLVERSFDRLVLVAPPKLLGELRENLSRGLQAKVVTEVHKDYVHLAIPDLMKHLGPPVGERPLRCWSGSPTSSLSGPRASPGDPPACASMTSGLKRRPALPLSAAASPLRDPGSRAGRASSWIRTPASR